MGHVLSLLLETDAGRPGESRGTNLFDIGITGEVYKKNEDLQLWRVESRVWCHSLESSANQSLGVEDSISGVHGSLIFSGITDQTFLSGEGDVGWCRAVSLYRKAKSRSCCKKGREGLTVIGDDFYSIVLPNANASFGRIMRGRGWRLENIRVSGTEVDTDSAIENIFHGDRRRVFFGEGRRDGGRKREGGRN